MGETRRARRALAVLVAGLAAANLARSMVVPRRWHLPYNLAIGAFAVVVGRAGGLTIADLGCAPEQARRGLVLGVKAFGAISAVLVVAAVLGALEDEQSDVSPTAAARRTLVVIPLGTVLVEELVFRGALYGLLEQVTTSGRATAAGAVLFGLWHIAPIWEEGVVHVSVTVAATTLAGVGFIWLRRRSGSVLAPMTAHLGTNSTTFALSWATSR